MQTDLIEQLVESRSFTAHECLYETVANLLSLDDHCASMQRDKYDRHIENLRNWAALCIVKLEEINNAMQADIDTSTSMDSAELAHKRPDLLCLRRIVRDSDKALYGV